jgi:hypothetical protein
MPFKITSHRGFHFTFENGWTVSVQFGPGNYCDHHHATLSLMDESKGPKALDCWESSNAEVAVWRDRAEGFLKIGECDTVVGWLDPEVVAALLNTVAELSAEATDEQAGALIRPLLNGLDDESDSPADAS